MSQQRVGTMARILGVQRDIDVLQALLRDHYYPHLAKPEQKILDKVLKSLGKQRKQAVKRTKKLIRYQRFTRFKQQWQQWLANPKYTSLAPVPLAVVLPDLLYTAAQRIFDASSLVDWNPD